MLYCFIREKSSVHVSVIGWALRADIFMLDRCHPLSYVANLWSSSLPEKFFSTKMPFISEKNEKV